MRTATATAAAENRAPESDLMKRTLPFGMRRLWSDQHERGLECSCVLFIYVARLKITWVDQRNLREKKGQLSRFTQ